MSGQTHGPDSWPDSWARLMARLVGCSFKSCKMQAVLIYKGGKLLEMEDCKVLNCGAVSQYSGVLVESGKAALRRCTLEGNEAEAIVVQGRDPNSPPMLTVEDSTIKDNQIGIMFGIGGTGGCGSLRGNTIEGNAVYGVTIYSIAATGQLLMEGNVLRGNGATAQRRPETSLDILCVRSSRGRLADQSNTSNRVWELPDLV